MLKIAYTYGDLGGIGPEIFHKFQESLESSPLVSQLKIKLIDEDLSIDKSKITPGKPNAYAGEHAAKALERASVLIKSGDYDYLITGPVAKESLWLAGIESSGQTELLASINGLNRDQIEMFFVLNNLKMVLATRHVPLKEVSNELSRRLYAVLENSKTALNKIYKIGKPKIAIAGLNPHAGENGLIGQEEKEIMQPTIEKFLSNYKNEIEVFGPYPADYLLAKAAQQYLRKEELDYDLYVSTYHDQALSLIKGLGGFEAVNLTMGLPFIRLSVDHGTAFDIVGTEKANFKGLEACTRYCFNLHKLG